METLAALPRDIWERTPPEAQAYIGTLEARVATLEDMVRTLQEQLNQSSRNSSRPPSSDPPQSQRPTRPRGQRRRGGQPGHPGQTRTLVPVEDVDDFSPRLKPGVSWVRTKQETPNALPTPLAPPFLPIAKARGISEDLDEIRSQKF